MRTKAIINRSGFLLLFLFLVFSPANGFLQGLTHFLNWPVAWKLFTSGFGEPYGVFFFQDGHFVFTKIQPKYSEELPRPIRYMIKPIFDDRMEKLFWHSFYIENKDRKNFYCRNYQIHPGQKVFLAPIRWRINGMLEEVKEKEGDFKVFMKDGFRIGYFEC